MLNHLFTRNKFDYLFYYLNITHQLNAQPVPMSHIICNVFKIQNLYNRITKQFVLAKIPLTSINA